ncbi:MAG: imidazolonepropionase, partial [Actinobacteria bacterium]|nr:imidazolonepropionase [Actinomycetota bacterium]
MTATLVTNIGQLVTNSDSKLGILNNAAFIYENGKVTWVGNGKDAPSADSKIDAEGGTVTPGFVDSHTHAVFAGDRSKDYEARMSGEKYCAGGIKTTVQATRNASDEELRANLERLFKQSRSTGTTTLEIKSGYGLDVETEKRILSIAKEFTAETTFLGAHVIPEDFTNKREKYVELVKGEMLDACAPFAKWIDVFCDTSAFTVDEAREILKAGILAAELHLASVDHCTHISDKGIDALAQAGVVATLLPGAEFFTRSPYPDARRFLNAGVTVALASDCNPGSSYISSMPVVMSIAIR